MGEENISALPFHTNVENIILYHHENADGSGSFGKTWQEIPLGAVMEELDRQIDAALPRKLTLDLSGLTFTDSSGIAVILRTYRRMSQLRGGMTVVHAPDQARRVFRAAGLEKLVRFE